MAKREHARNYEDRTDSRIRLHILNRLADLEQELRTTKKNVVDLEQELRITKQLPAVAERREPTGGGVMDERHLEAMEGRLLQAINQALGEMRTDLLSHFHNQHERPVNEMAALRRAVTEPLLRLPDVRTMVGIGRSEIYRRIEAGSFPRPMQVGKNFVAWGRSDIMEWIGELKPNRRKLSHVTAEDVGHERACLDDESA